MTKEEITQEYDFSWRQAGYYSDAAIYLGLVNRERENRISTYKLTEKGINLFKLSIFDRKFQLIQLILTHEVFNKTLKLYFKQGYVSNKKDIIEIMSDSNLYNIKSGKTYERRSSTVLGWIKWIISLVEE
ncbi:hypothetical protein [Chamaesiphon sp.]|uniref:DUF7226 domain-containing protein n=1 Tax=Chamaesiphon sp. TaxID=2814140 RepID=UPI0035934F7B